jgi:hypothetical protein
MGTNAAPLPGRHLVGKVEDHKTLTGNQILIQIAGQTVGRCQSITHRESFGTEPLYELGSMLPAELVPLRWSGSLTVDKYRLRQSAFDKTPVKYGENVLKQQLFDVVVVDKVTGNVVEKFRGCVQSDLSGAFPANRASTQNVTFLYMEHVDGADLARQANVQQQ